MFRAIKISALASAAISIALAGPIAGTVQYQIGGANGLTSSYITGNGGSVSTWTEQNYDTNLFSGATLSAVAPTPYTGYSTSSASTGTLTDSTDGVTFAMINDGTTSGTSNNVWVGTSSGNPSIIIPIGIFGVTDVWTMLNSEMGGASTLRDATLLFTFGATPTATTGLTTLQVKVVNSGVTGSGATGSVRNAVDCVTGCTGTPSTYGTDNGDNGPTARSTTFTGATVLTANLYTSAYNGATGALSGTTGNINLDTQGFVFTGSTLTTALSSYLVSVKVSEVGTGGGNSALGLSAITVDAVPEPSTIALFIGGLSVLGLGRKFRK